MGLDLGPVMSIKPGNMRYIAFIMTLCTVLGLGFSAASFDKVNKRHSGSEDGDVGSFITGPKDPFREMEEFHERMMKQLELISKRSDQNADEKIGGSMFSGIEYSSEDRKDQVLMKFRIPGLESNSVNIDINDKSVYIECDMRKVEEEKDKNGNTVFRAVNREHFSQIVPLPKNVNPGNAVVDTKNDEIVISFPKMVAAD